MARAAVEFRPRRTTEGMVSRPALRPLGHVRCCKRNASIRAWNVQHISSPSERFVQPSIVVCITLEASSGSELLVAVADSQYSGWTKRRARQLAG